MFILFWIFIQVIAEVLPVSSSGHIFLLRKIWSCLNWSIGENIPWETIDFLLHIPTFCILLIFFFARWWKMVFQKPISFDVFFQKDAWIRIGNAALFLGSSSLITFLFWWKRYYGYFAVPVTVGFLCTAIAMWCLKYLPYGKGCELYLGGSRSCLWQTRDGVVLGFIQGAMMNAGFSRFGFTLITGRLLGYNAETAFAISFLLEAPLLFGASIRGLFDLYKNPEIITEYFAIPGLFVMLIATILSYFVLKLVHRLVQKDKLHYVAWYMIIPLTISFVFERCS